MKRKSSTLYNIHDYIHDKAHDSYIKDKIGCAWVQVTNATLNFGIICQKKRKRVYE